ncbi:MAG: helix-turn-helix transcriptional regulator [Ruminococcus sp.]|nr:helix-turn-helix transcriptional regulator [Ruminococcus sp.]
MDFMDKVSKRIIELRESNGETQQELADVIGITRQSLSRYELATRTINVDVLGKLAQHFNVTTDYLMGLSDVKSTEQEIKIACAVTGLSEKAIENIKSSMSYDLSTIPEINTFENSQFVKMSENEKNKLKELQDFILHANRTKKKYVNSFIENDCFIETMDLLKRSCDAFTLKQIERYKKLDIDNCDDFYKIVGNVDSYFQADHYNTLYKAGLMDIYEKIKNFIKDNAVIIAIEIKEDTNNAEHNTPKE